MKEGEGATKVLANKKNAHQNIEFKCYNGKTLHSQGIFSLQPSYNVTFNTLAVKTYEQYSSGDTDHHCSK